MKATNITKTYKNFTLNIPSLHLPPGRIYGILGANGCGKSTLLKLLTGLETPDQGHINWEGLTPQDITLVPQKPYLMETTVLKNLQYPLKIRKTTSPHIDKYLDLAGLTQLKNNYAPGLSSGEGQKLALIRAMIFDPKYIFIDETFSNMDTESQLKFEAHILKSPATYVIISHQLATIKRLCNHIIFMENGQITEAGAADEIFANPQSPGLQRFLQLH